MQSFLYYWILKQNLYALCMSIVFKIMLSFELIWSDNNYSIKFLKLSTFWSVRSRGSNFKLTSVLGTQFRTCASLKWRGVNKLDCCRVYVLTRLHPHPTPFFNCSHKQDQSSLVRSLHVKCPQLAKCTIIF